MYRTFTLEYRNFQELDEFLERIENSGYEPVFMREAYHWEFFSGRRELVLETAVTARKKGA